MALSLNSNSMTRWPIFTLLILLVFCCGGLIYSAQSFRDRIEAIRAADSDNFGWVVSQLDVDFRALELSIDRLLLLNYEPLLSPTDISDFDVRRKFDIFYSRVETIETAIARSDANASVLNVLEGISAKRDELASYLDATVVLDKEKLEKFRHDVIGCAADVRTFTTQALLWSTRQSDIAREEEQVLLTRFWTQSYVLLAFVIVAACFVVALWYQLEDRTRKMERALNSAARVFEVTTNGVIISDLSGRLKLVNPSAEKMFGVLSGSAQNYNICDFVAFTSSSCNISNEDLLSEVASGFKLSSAPARVHALRSDGTEFPTELSIYRDKDIDGTSILITIIRDISKAVRFESEIIEARDLAQRSSVAKSRFFATMSHEMRTPLHGVIASLDLIEDSSLPSDARELVSTARLCSERAIQQINSVLEVSQVAERASLKENFDIRHEVDQIVSEFYPTALRKGLNLEYVVDTSIPKLICFGCRDLVIRVIYNLVANAIKFTVEGSVVVRLQVNQNKDGTLKVKLSVEDTGIGISDSDLERIFDEFQTVSSAKNEVEDSSGLGLFLVKSAISEIGGYINVESSIGVGSIFCFEMDIQVGNESSGSVARNDCKGETQSGSLNVLVVDDKHINTVLMSKMLQQLGHSVSEVHSGLEAVSVASAQKFDLILMDLSMPQMSGAEVTRMIRLSGMSKDSMIVGVTAFTDEVVLSDFRNAGVQKILIKPVRKQELNKCIGEVMGGVRTSELISEISEEFSILDALIDLQNIVGKDEAASFIKKALSEATEQNSTILSDHFNFEERAEKIHAAVGITGMVGLGPLSCLLAEAELRLRSHDLTGLPKLQKDIMIWIENESRFLEEALVLT